MTQGLFAAVSGIRANQTRLNVISNNIANLNTVGFKASSVNFQTIFSSTLSPGSSPGSVIGGTNPKQMGAGVQIADISTTFNQGGSQFTGRNTDLQINGEGFFAVERPDLSLTAGLTTNTQYYMTRAGNFSLDSDGSLVTSSGFRVRGTSQLSGTGTSTLSTINIPQEFLIVKDLDVDGNILATHFAPLGTDPADIAAAMNGGAIEQSIASVKLTNFTIGNDGAISAAYSNGDRITVRTDQNTVSASDPTSARREIIHMTAEGGIFGADNDGDTLPSRATDAGIVDQIGAGVFQAPPGGIALEGSQMQLQIATVTNPGGLLYEGNSNFILGTNTGNVFFGTPASESRGSLQSGTLETSNVDLASEFTNMIVAQRGLEANSRVIRSQSEVLQSIINIV